jgi:hypothetical protein
MLQLRQVFLSRRFLGKRPRQHEFRLKHRPGCIDQAVDGGGQIADHRMLDPPLYIRQERAGLSLPTVKRVEAEKGPRVSEEARLKLQQALELEGIAFIPENGGGPGVRLRKRRTKPSK